MRSVKCNVVYSEISIMPANPKPKPVSSLHEALAWISEVGWGHVSYGDCDLPKCVSSKVFIDKGWITYGSTPFHAKPQPYINYKAMYANPEPPPF